MGRISTAESIKDYFSKGINKQKWAEAKEKAKSLSTFGKYDDGKYEGQLISIKTGRSKNGRLQVVMLFKFTSGDYKGKTHSKYIGVEDSTEYLLNDLKVLGYDEPETADEIEDVIFKELNKKKPVVSIRLKTKEGTEYQNTYLAVSEKAKSEEEDVTDTEEADVEPEGTSDSVEKSDDENVEEGKEEAEEEVVEADEDAEEEPETPKKKKPKAPEPEVEEKEEAEEPEGDKLDVGSKVLVRVGEKEIKAEVVKILRENKDNTGEILAKSLKTGKKYTIAVPDDIVELISDEE